MSIVIDRLDHLVLTVADIEATCSFYEAVLGMTPISFGDGRRALRFGRQKINLHPAGRELEPKAQTPRPGSADLCFISVTSLERVQMHLQQCGIELLEGGPSQRSGATGPIMSLYFRDPDGNLIEVSEYIP
ncbi:MAG: catechol 2,3-dioxygenase-like lactoylglutathione lyase family enzyme [Gammaproteobacteria bacterium]|jgi:catechol 2,3-dioxygenase-like lactoylglutathione lyase family enzyme